MTFTPTDTDRLHDRDGDDDDRRGAGDAGDHLGRARRGSPTARRCPRRSSTRRRAWRGPSPTRRPPGTVLKAGSDALSVTFTPTDTTDYTTATADDDDRGGAGDAGDHLGRPRRASSTARRCPRRSSTRRRAWRGPSPTRRPPGSVPKAGSDTLSVTFTPTDTTDYTTGDRDDDASPWRRRRPTITWAAPAGIAYGTALSATQLDATSSVPGTFAYSPAAGLGAEGGERHAVGDLHAHRHHRLHDRHRDDDASPWRRRRRRSPGPRPRASPTARRCRATQLDATAERAGDLRLLAGRRARC